jgi:hypothetical protein
MLVSDIINLATKRMDLDSDDYDQQVVILHINSGIARLNNEQVKVKDPLVVKSLTLTGTTAKPADFFKLMNGYPVLEATNTLGLLPGAPSTVTIKYLTYKPLLTSIGDAIPLPDYFIGQLVDYVCIHLQNDIEADITQDSALSNSDESILTSAKGG